MLNKIIIEIKLENMTDSRMWSEKHRQRIIKAGYKIKEIQNPSLRKPIIFTDFLMNIFYMISHSTITIR